MGPPGAGKSTQTRFVAQHFRIPAISTGDIFRANVSEGTPLGVEAKRFMDAGEYVPDEVTNLMVRNRIDEPDAERGFLLDGYPRTLAQVEELDGMIAFTGHRLDAAVALTVDEDETTGWAMPTKSPSASSMPSTSSPRADGLRDRGLDIKRRRVACSSRQCPRRRRRQISRCLRPLGRWPSGARAMEARL